MTISQYLTRLNTLYITGNAREHSYRGDLAILLETLLPDVLVTNEPARVACGAPDYVLTRKDIPVGYIEAKDIGVDLGSKTLKEQFDRYKAGLANLIITDYLDFHFYKDGALVAKTAIGRLEGNVIVPVPENFEHFAQLIKNFAETITQTIKSPTRLAEMMAGKAKLMADVIERSLNSDEESGKQSGLYKQMLSFRQMLIHDITNRAFADIYAQTIAYGMFAARYHDPTLPTFSREEAATLIPKSNPFLRKLFHDIAGPDLDDRILWIVEELVRIFLATDVASIMKNFGKSTKQEDPVVHFYETFLASYSPALRKARGVWYTPQPVVNFIVRAVDDILKTEFGLKDGLADTSKTKIKVKAHKFDERSKNKSKITGEQEIEKEVHRVQILDPATGTGTFLAEVVRHIYKKFEGQRGIWNQYVNEHLIPRLNGFELLMASYAMAHLKMDMLLTETGYTPTDDQRFKIFLTNSLEEPSNENIDLFSILADEANAANQVKREAPVMVVIGNPPYSVSSTNKSPWIESLTADYKKDMKERNIQPLSDDYIKFIRFGEHFINKNGEGILAYISNNSFIDGIIHRQMRKHLLESFDKIYIVDLHGNSKKQEASPDGSVDQNVFDIMQGVSINIFIKKGVKKNRELGEVYQIDLFGKRQFKYDYLNSHGIENLQWNNLDLNEPNYKFCKQNIEALNDYSAGVWIEKLFKLNATGVKTERDDFTIKFNFEETTTILNDLLKLTVDEIRSKHNLKPDGRDWTLATAKNDLVKNKYQLVHIQYRPFDYRTTIYTGVTKGYMAYPREKIMSHLTNDNIALVTTRLNRGLSAGYNFLSKDILDLHLLDSAADSLQTFPLYLYPETNGQLSTEGEQTRVPNLNPEIVKQIADGLGLQFVPEREGEGEVCFANSAEVRPEFRNTFAPIDLLDYIYAVLHSPAYREKYKEFLKIDFPRVPYPTDAPIFWQLVQLGGELRRIHLLESEVVERPITQFNIDGDYKVDKPRFVLTHGHTEPDEVGSHTETGKSEAGSPLERGRGCVYINETQHFENVPEVAWNFYIGGYQPAQKWLKDRKGRELSIEDIMHYQKIIVALTETDSLMKEIDKVLTV